MPIFELENSELLITNYVNTLKKEIDHYAEILTDKELKTLYFGGGTPSRIGIDRIIDIIEYIRTKFDFENLAELSIELNPYPEEEVLGFVKNLNKKYPKISRLRYSFGIQSFDDEVLKITGRAYSFTGIVEFLRSLIKLKQDNNVFNFDFIAFGKFQVSKNGFKQLWHEFKRDFFQKFLNSGYVDSISLYTLEGVSPPQPSPLHGEGVKLPIVYTVSNNKLPSGNFMIGLAQNLRKNQTKAESFLWELLRRKQLNNLKFRRQHPIGDYIADFYCPEKKLVIELDGSIHNNKEQKEHDQLRDAIMQQHNITVIRFTNNDVFEKIENILQTIIDVSNKPPRSTKWRGVGGEETCSQKYFGTDDEIMEEFLIVKEMVEDAGFGRYEISNFAAAGKASIHNMVYWNMEYYLGLGLSAASFAKVPLDKANEVKSSEAGRGNEGGFKRWTNTADIKQYLEGKWIDEQQTQSLNESDLLIEEFFLRLRTREGIADLSKFTSALVPNYEGLITNYTGAGLVEYDGVKLKLTDKGMNVYNSIITDLLQKI
ncbi:MAG: DUF559 domain-containing protein [Candidatus Absconditabacterales bacterium]